MCHKNYHCVRIFVLFLLLGGAHCTTTLPPPIYSISFIIEHIHEFVILIVYSMFISFLNGLWYIHNMCENDGGLRRQR